jgi:hypothetical protein
MDNTSSSDADPRSQPKANVFVLIAGCIVLAVVIVSAASIITNYVLNWIGFGLY